MPLPNELYDRAQPYYGMCGNFIKVRDTVLEAVEDECDGYRSSLKDLRVVTDKTVIKEQIFSPIPLSFVKLVNVEEGDFQGTAVEDYFIEHRWAILGTHNWDDYYPSFRVVNYALAPDAQLKWRDSNDPLTLPEFEEFIESIVARIEEAQPNTAARHRRDKKRAARRAENEAHEKRLAGADSNWGLF